MLIGVEIVSSLKWTTEIREFTIHWILDHIKQSTINMEDNISARDSDGKIINGSMFFIARFIRGIILLITFPFRAIGYILNPFAAKNIRIKK
jgi:hypothetical protein